MEWAPIVKLWVLEVVVEVGLTELGMVMERMIFG